MAASAAWPQLIPKRRAQRYSLVVRDKLLKKENRHTQSPFLSRVPLVTQDSDMPLIKMSSNLINDVWIQ